MKKISLLFVFLFSTLIAEAVCSVQATTTPCTCYNACNGTATLTPAGGTPPYSYSWSPGGQTTAHVTGLCAGSNTAYVTDSQGCTATIVVIITQPSQISISVTSQPATCSNCCDGTGTSTVSGGLPPYTYVWSPASNETTANASSLCSGPCNFCVTDTNNCTVCHLFTVGNSVGMEETSVYGNLSVFPNPSAEQVNVKASFEQAVAIELVLTNMLGEIIYTEKQEKALAFDMTVDISKLPAGVYFVGIKSAGGISVRRVVKE